MKARLRVLAVTAATFVGMVLTSEVAHAGHKFGG